MARVPEAPIEALDDPRVAGVYALRVARVAAADFVASRPLLANLDVSDIEAVAAIGAWQAIGTWDPAGTSTLTGWVWHRARWACIDQARSDDWLSRGRRREVNALLNDPTAPDLPDWAKRALSITVGEGIPEDLLPVAADSADLIIDCETRDRIVAAYRHVRDGLDGWHRDAFDDWLTGGRPVDLAARYGVTSPRVSQLIAGWVEAGALHFAAFDPDVPHVTPNDLTDRRRRRRGHDRPVPVRSAA